MSDTVECPHGPDPSTFEMCSDCMNSWYGRVDDLERKLAEAQRERDCAVSELRVSVTEGHKWDERYADLERKLAEARGMKTDALVVAATARDVAHEMELERDAALEELEQARGLLVRLLPFAWSTPHDARCTVDANQDNCSCGKNAAVVEVRAILGESE